MKKVLSLILVAMLAVSFVVSSASAVETEIDNSVQENAAASYDELMSSFSCTYSGNGEKIYPDYYGGSYINDEGQLVVYVTNDVQRPTVLSDNSDVIYEPCAYSYNELLSVMETLNDYKFSYPDDAIANNFNQFGLYDSENRVIVRLDDLSDERVNEFKENVCDSDAIEFKQGYGPILREVNVNAGDGISFSGGSASIGYRVKRDGVEGFVAAGHSANSIGKSIKYGGIAFATCKATQIEGNADCAFCAITNSSYSLTNTLSGTSNTLSTTISEPGVGTVINKIGMTTGHTSGKVLSTNVSITFSDGLTTSNLTSADYESDSGDSGCVVYSYIGSTGARLTLGIHTGSSSDGSEALYSKANEINDALGTSRY